LLFSTKLAVCTGDGSHFDKHYDNACARRSPFNTLLFCNILQVRPPIALSLPAPFSCKEITSSHSLRIASGGADLRKLTTVYYLNPSWRESHGGLFRIFHPPPNHDKFTDIQPRGDRLMVFW
jgi:hypothetical protein